MTSPSLFAAALVLLTVDGYFTVRRVSKWGEGCELNPIVQAAIRRFGPLWGVVLGLTPYAAAFGLLAAFKLDLAAAFLLGALAKQVLQQIQSRRLELAMTALGIEFGRPASAPSLPSAP